MSSLKLYTDIFKKSIDEKLELAGDVLSKNTANFVINEFSMFPDPPVKTGNLRRSVRGINLGGGKGIVTAGSIIGKEINYSVFVEYGTRYMPPRPFFRNGTERSKSSNAELLKKLIG